MKEQKKLSIHVDYFEEDMYSTIEFCVFDAIDFTKSCIKTFSPPEVAALLKGAEMMAEREGLMGLGFKALWSAMTAGSVLTGVKPNDTALL